MRYTGSCLCGGVQYTLGAELGAIEVCYCQMCRKASGGPLATNAPFAAAAFHVTAGRELLAEYESSPGVREEFSARGVVRRSTAASARSRSGCGYGWAQSNEPLNVRPAAKSHVGSRCNWWEIRERLPGFDVE
jgi:hypothetical protein